MLLILLYAALIALIGWSVFYLIWRVVRSFRGKGGCSCGRCNGSCRTCAGAKRLYACCFVFLKQRFFYRKTGAG